MPILMLRLNCKEKKKLILSEEVMRVFPPYVFPVSLNFKHVVINKLSIYSIHGSDLPGKSIDKYMFSGSTQARQILGSQPVTRYNHLRQ